MLVCVFLTSRPPPVPTLTDTLFPCPTLVRSACPPEVERMRPPLIEGLSEQAENRRGVDDGCRADALAQALHHHGRDDVNGVAVDQLLLAARRRLLLVVHHQRADGPVDRKSVV